MSLVNSKIIHNFAVIFGKAVKTLKQYNISIAKLEDKQYVHEFEGGNDLFTAFEQDLVENGQFNATVTLDKSATMIQAKFKITGVLALVCDRSLEVFDFPFETEEKLILKFGDRWEEITEEIMMIPRDTSIINIAQYLYEFITLTVPMKKLHPRFQQAIDENEDDFEEGILIYSTAPEKEEESEDDEPNIANIDPRWAALQQLKDK